VTADADQLYLDDLPVGRTFATRTHALDSAQIKRFAAEFDPQPFHLDEATAERTFFQGLAASGWHTMAITMRLMVEGVPIAGGIIGSGAELSWPQATRPGDILQVYSEVLENTPSKSRPDRGRIVLRSETRNQRGEVVQVMVGRLVVPRKVIA
jgi:acyl dehydratase